MATPTRSFHSTGGPDYYLHLLDKALNEERISSEEEKLIRRFVRDKLSDDNISPLRCTKLVQTLISWRRFFPASFQNATIDDIKDAKIELDRAVSEHTGKTYSQNTKNDHVRILKTFYRWMTDNQYSSVDMDKIKRIKAPGVNINTANPEDLLTPIEIGKIIQSCRTIRDKAIISVLYESGVRIGELARLTWGDLQEDDYGIGLNIDDTKTRKTRYVRLIESVEYLATWRNAYYTGEPFGDAPVFISKDGKSMEYRAIAQVISRAGERAGIKKRIHCHLFRKSRITELVKGNYQESMIKECMWGNIRTDMMAVYVKLSKKDIDRAFLKQSGIEMPEDEDLKPHGRIRCRYCYALNPPSNLFCSGCLKPLGREGVEIQEDLIKDVEGLPPEKFQALMLKLLKAKYN